MLIVLKIGGKTLEKNLDNIVKSLSRLPKKHQVILVHGGGDIVTHYSMKMGIEPRFIVSPNGIKSRFTSKDELDVYVMVMAGMINKQIVKKILQEKRLALGISGIDGGMVLAQRKKRLLVIDEKGRKRVIEGGYTGKITHVNPEILSIILKRDIIPVIAPIAISNEGEILNVDSDQMATELSIAVKSDLLIFLTDAPGVIIDGKVKTRITVKEAEEYASIIGYGMNRKLMLASKAVKNEVRKAIIANGLVNNPIENALKEIGSVIE